MGNIGTETAALTRLTFNAVPRSIAALQAAVELGGDNHTDTLNRAIQLYAFYVKTVADGGRLIVQEADRNLRPLDLF